jgi:O-Antigen ligase
MTITTTGLRPSREAQRRSPAAGHGQRRPPRAESERWVRRRVGLVWALLVLNALTWYSGVSAIHVPNIIGKGITQGALPLALVLAVSVNRRLVIRPNVFLCLLSLLLFGAILDALMPQYFGTVYRTVRLLEFICALWLLTPWWGRRDMLLLRCHLTMIGTLLVTVILGIFVSPGDALVQGRLTGALWPVPPTQVAHYAAVATGLILLMWLCGRIRGWRVFAVLIALLMILILTHTRTALLGLVVGLVVAGLSLAKQNARIRKVYITAGIVAAVAVATLSGFIVSWLARGEGTKELTDLTGRTVVWSGVLGIPRNTFQMIFGSGLSNSSYQGLPIDSNWLSSYDELGLFGVSVCIAVFVYLLVHAYFQPASMERALALFLVVYCLMASFTETGITDASTYMLEVTLAASLLVPARTWSTLGRWRPTRVTATASAHPAPDTTGTVPGIAPKADHEQETSLDLAADFDLEAALLLGAGLEAETAYQPATRPEPIAASGEETDLEPEAELTVEGELTVEPVPEPTTEAEAEATAEAELTAEPEPTAEAGPTAEPELAWEPEQATETEPAADTETAAEPEPAADSEPETELELAVDSWLARYFEQEAEHAPAATPEPESELEPELDPEPELALEAEPEPEAERRPNTEPVLTTEPEPAEKPAPQPNPWLVAYLEHQAATSQAAAEDSSVGTAPDPEPDYEFGTDLELGADFWRAVEPGPEPAVEAAPTAELAPETDLEQEPDLVATASFRAVTDLDPETELKSQGEPEPAADVDNEADPEQNA